MVGSEFDTNSMKRLQKLKSCHYRFSKKCFQHFVESMPGRTEAFMRAKGGSTSFNIVFLVSFINELSQFHREGVPSL